MKFDITKVPGYAAEMSAEDKLKLIEGFEIDLSGYVLKSVSDKNASEAAEYKKKYNATLTEQERREAELAEINKQRDAELAQLKRERAIDQQTAKYISLGFDAELATATAIASVEGNTDTVFANIAKHLGNVLEPVTTAMHPEILRIKTALHDKGALGTLMSGSGPTVFGLFEDEEI